MVKSKGSKSIAFVAFYKRSVRFRIVYCKLLVFLWVSIVHFFFANLISYYCRRRWIQKVKKPAIIKQNLTFRSIIGFKTITDDGKSDTCLKKIHPSELELARNVNYKDDFFLYFGNVNREQQLALQLYDKEDLLYSVNHVTTKLQLGLTFFHRRATNPFKNIKKFQQ